MKEKKKNIFQRNSIETILIILTLVILGLEITDYIYENKRLSEIEKMVNNDQFNKNFEKLSIVLNDSTIAPVTKDVYTLQKDLLKIKEKQNTLETLVENKHHDWLAYFANFWAILGLVFGSLAVVFSYKSKIKTEVDKQVAIEIDKQIIHINHKIKDEVELKVIEQVAIANNISKKVVERVYFTEKENTLLRNQTKVLLINEEGTGIDSWLDKVFNKGSELSKFDTISKPIEKFEEINDFKDYTLIVIDNTKLNRKNWGNLSDKAGNLSEYGNQLLDLTKKALSKGIAILYFSDDVYYPSTSQKFLELPNKGLLAYGNAHSKIYPNAMDVLKSRKLFK